MIKAFELYGTIELKGASLVKAELQSVEGTTSRFSTNLSSSIRSMGANLPLIAGAATALASTLGGALAGVWKLATSAAEAGGHLQDLAQQTNYSVETLSALRAVANTSGTDLDSLTGSLVIFQKNLAKAADGNEHLTTAFKTLGVTSYDNETALNQVITGLFNVKDKTQQTALAMEVFGRSGKGMLGIVKETGGSLDETTAKLRKWGLIVSTEDAVAADHFDDQLKDLDMRFKGLARVVGQQTLPAFAAFFESIEASMDANKTDWKAWGEGVAMAILSAESLLGGFANFARNLDWTNLIPWYGPIKAMKDFASGTDAAAESIMNNYNRLKHPTFDTTDLGPSAGILHKKSSGDDEDEVGTVPRRRLRAPRAPRVPRHHYAETPIYQNTVSGEGVGGTSESSIDKIIKFREAQAKAIQEMITPTNRWMGAVNDLVASLKKEGVTLGENAEYMLRVQAIGGLFADDMQRLSHVLADMPDMPEPQGMASITGITDEDVAQRAGAAADIAAGTPPKNIYESLVKTREQMGVLAGDLRNIFEQATRDGVTGGFKGALKTLEQGLLSMASKLLFDRVESGLSAALQHIGAPHAASTSGAEGGNSGGGLLSSIFGSLFGGHRASGGGMQAGRFYVAGEHGRELIAGPGHVYNARETRGMMSGGGEQRTIVAFGDREMQEALMAAERNPKVRRTRLISAKYMRKLQTVSY